MSRRLKSVAGLVMAGGLAAGLALGVGGCKRAAPAPAGPAAAPEVVVMTLEPRTIPIEYNFVGRTEASKRVEIRARVQGFLMERRFEEGKEVKEGDLLFLIDPRDYEADLEIAKARLQQAEAQARLAQLDFNRFTQAAQSGAASPRDVDQAQTQLSEAQASISLARAEIAKATLNLSYTRVESPVTGMIGRADVDQGAYVEPGTRGLLATATQTDPMYVTFPISERTWLKWREEVEAGLIKGEKDNPPVRLVLLDGTSYDEQGRLNFFDPTVDPQTGTAVARAAFANPANFLKPGQFVRVVMDQWERPNAITVPQSAVSLNPAGAAVLIVDENNVVQVRPVRVGEWRGADWHIEHGLKAGDRVIVEGQIKARPGMTVRPVAATGVAGGTGDAAVVPAAGQPGT